MMDFNHAFILLFLVGCSRTPKQPPTPAAQAHQAFHTLCAPCHGQNGRGDGPAAAGFDPKPRNYTDKAWQASVTDDHIRHVILNGGTSVGLSSLMPAWPQFKAHPKVLDELVRIVRGFGQ